MQPDVTVPLAGPTWPSSCHCGSLGSTHTVEPNTGDGKRSAWRPPRRGQGRRTQLSEATRRGRQWYPLPDSSARARGGADSA